MSGPVRTSLTRKLLVPIRQRFSTRAWKKILGPSVLFDSAFYLKHNPDLAHAGVDPLAHYLRFGGFEARDPHPLFDSDFYLAQNPEVAAARLNPLVHYVTYGWREHRNPHPLFDVAFYTERYPDVAQNGSEPLQHFLMWGAAEKRDPHPLFDSASYIAQNPEMAAGDLNPLVHYVTVGWRERPKLHPLFDAAFYLERHRDVAQNGSDPLQHYLIWGATEDRDPHPLFDNDYYLAQNVDVAAERLNPLVHFVTRGWRERRNPNPFFDVGFYMQRYPDVARSGSNPLHHYFISGLSEKRDPHPAFDSHFYIERNPEVLELGINPLVHYLEHGGSPNRYFDVSFYLENNPHVSQNGIEAMQHYLRRGASEVRNPHPLFDTGWYLRTNPEVAANGENPLLHFLQRGRLEGRDPHPLFDSKFYTEQYPELRNIPPTDHYLHGGGLEGRDPHPLFDSDWYRAQSVDAAQWNENPLVDYVRRGWKEKRSPCALFDGAFYLERNPDVAEGNISSLHHYLIYGAAEGRDPSPWFDTDWYVAQNPEIVLAGWNPLVHYARIGAREGRLPRAESKTIQRATPAKHGGKRIVFVSGEPQTPGHHYRIANVASSLSPRFFETLVLTNSDVAHRIDEIAAADLVWIWRARLSPETATLVTTARAAGATIVFDVDDLMFCPEIASTELIDGIRTQNISETEVQKFYTSLRVLLMEADRCTAPTVPLVREIRNIHKPASLIPNGFDRQTLECARAALHARRAQPDDGLVRIGYASGTLTHQRDFAVVSEALAAVLRENASARLVLFRGGIELAEFPALEKLQEQIEWRSRVPIEHLPWEYARFDINIAPLEVGNRYCEAKSELKFFEAALAGVPTIASPTAPFKEAIKHGHTGLLASSDAQWREALKRLLGDRELRRSMADRAYEEVLWLYGPERRALLVTRLVNELLAPPPLRFDLFRLQMQTDSAADMPAVAVSAYDVLFQSPRKSKSRISVVIPLFNYGHLLEEALESVRQQTMREIDVIVVDDRSSDNSVLVAHRWLEQHADEFNMVALLQNRSNAKLGRTRNTAVHFSDTELYMALDPDNALYPDCLEKCMAQLDETGAAFAYPTCTVFGDKTGQIGLLEYDPALFPCANYIDAMAMVRKACWIAVGGYSALDPMGWEDYEFWCKLAEKGLFGVRVQEPTARYRLHSASMLRTITDLPENKPRVTEDLNERHPWLQLAMAGDAENPHSGANIAESLADKMREAPKGVGMDLGGLLSILRCPETGERLIRENEVTLVSEVSGRCWPIVKRRPVFTPEGLAVAIQSEAHISNALPEAAISLIENSSGLVLNLSAGATTRRFPNVIELEYTIFKHTDIAGDVKSLPFQDEIFEVVVCLNAFEHYREPITAMEEIRRVLKPGGRVFIHTAFLQPVHEAPYHYFPCTEFGLREWMRHFKLECLHVPGNFHPVYTLSWLASEAEYGLSEGGFAEAARVLRAAQLSELLGFWRNRESPTRSELWDALHLLPVSTQHKLAAGWEVVGRKV